MRETLNLCASLSGFLLVFLLRAFHLTLHRVSNNNVTSRKYEKRGKYLVTDRSRKQGLGLLTSLVVSCFGLAGGACEL